MTAFLSQGHLYPLSLRRSELALLYCVVAWTYSSFSTKALHCRRKQGSHQANYSVVENEATVLVPVC